METIRTLIVFLLFMCITPGFNKRGGSSNICIFQETVNQTKCKIKITEQDGNIKKRAKCEIEKNKSTSKSIIFKSIFPTNQECKGLVFNITLKLKGKNGKRAKVTKVYWQRVEENSEECSLKQNEKQIPKNLRGLLRNGKEQSAYWMKRVHGWRRIHQLSIPGTHDTMAYKGTWATVWHLCQSISLRTQLQKGVRFFDIRLGIRGTKLGAYHGDGWKKAFLDSYFYQIMLEFYKFLRAHPSEGIIFRYKDETGVSGDFCGMFDRNVRWYLNYIWKSESGYKSDLGTDYPTLSQIRGKIVIIRVNKKCGYGYKFTEMELDNYSGGGTNPFTGRPVTDDMVGWSRRKKKRSAEEVADEREDNFVLKNHSGIIKDTLAVDEYTEDSTDLYQNMKGHQKLNQSLYSVKNFFNNDDLRNNQTDQKQEQESAALKTGLSHNLNISDIEEIQRMVKSEGLCNINKTERIILQILCSSGVIDCNPIHLITKPNKNVRIIGASAAYKNELTNALDYTKGNSFSDYLVTIYASATKFPYPTPKGFARGVNPHLRQYLDFNWGRTGILAFDFITDWDGNMPFYVFRRNWHSSVCAKFYEHWNLIGSSISIADEVRNLVYFGWNDRITSVWIAPGCRVYMYEHTHWGGRYIYTSYVRNYGQVISNLGTVITGSGHWNDRLSSVRCECYENYLPNI